MAVQICQQRFEIGNAKSKTLAVLSSSGTGPCNLSIGKLKDRTFLGSLSPRSAPQNDGDLLEDLLGEDHLGVANRERSAV